MVVLASGVGRSLGVCALGRGCSIGGCRLWPWVVVHGGAVSVREAGSRGMEGG